MNLKNVNKRLVIGMLMTFVGMVSLMVSSGTNIWDAIGVCFFGGVTCVGVFFIASNY